MAGVFARLKWRLVRNGLSRGWEPIVGLVVGLTVAVPLALLAGLGLAFERGSPNQGPILVLGTCALLLVWAVLPVFGFGSDETLDPARLVPLPLRAGQLQLGLFASLIGVPALATLIVVAGGLVGVLRPGPGLAIAGPAAALVVAQSIVASRAVVTSLSGLLRTRRGRDLTVMLIGFVIVGSQGLRFLIDGVASAAGSDGLRRTTDVVRWLPPAWAGEALAAVGEDRLVDATLALAGGGAFLFALVAWWRVALGRVLTSADTSGTPSRARAGGPARLSLFPKTVRLLPRDRVGAVVAKELRYAWRDPRRRVQVIPNLALPAAGVGLVALQPRTWPTEVLLAAGVGALVALNGLNLFGLDGPGYWVHVNVGGDPRPDILAKNLAMLIEVLSLVTLAAVALAAVSGGWIYVPAALLLAAPVTGVQAAVGNVVSVLLPQPVPQTGSPWASTSGQGCATGLLVLLAMVGELLLLLPIAVPVAVAAVLAPAWLLAVGPAVFAYGATLWWLGLGVAARQLRGREPELLAKVDVRAIA